MVEIQLESEEPRTKVPTTLLERTLTTGEVIEVNSWSGTKTKTNKDKTTREVKSEKVYLNIQVGKDIVSCWMNADVKKGSDPAYNTLSYTNLVNLKLLDNFKEEVMKAANASVIVDLKFVELYFKNKLLNKKIKFVPETRIAKDEKQTKFSVVETIEGFA